MSIRHSKSHMSRLRVHCLWAVIHTHLNQQSTAHLDWISSWSDPTIARCWLIRRTLQNLSKNHNGRVSLVRRMKWSWKFGKISWSFLILIKWNLLVFLVYSFVHENGPLETKLFGIIFSILLLFLLRSSLETFFAASCLPSSSLPLVTKEIFENNF